MQPKTSFSYYITLVFATFFMGSSFIASKILLKTIPPFVLVGWRFAVAALATLPIIWLMKQDIKALFSPEFKKIAIVGSLQTAGTMGLLFLSMLYISASTAAVLLFTNPIWVAVFSPILLKERIEIKHYIGLLLGIIGVILVIGVKTEGNEWKGYLYGLGSALCWTSATLFVKKYPIKVAPFVLNFGQMLVGAVILILFSFILQENYTFTTDSKSVGWFLWLAIPASTGSFSLWYLALSKGGAMRSSSFLFLTPLFTIILSFFILNSVINFSQICGAVLIGMALYIVNK